jgi:hypothetical protein
MSSHGLSPDDLGEGEVDPPDLARRLAMSGVAGGYTLVLADEAHDGAPVNDYIVTDGGVLFATRDHGASWRCFGLVDPEMFLLELGFMEAFELTEADALPAATRHRFLAI